MDNPFVVIMLIIIVILALVIALLANLVLGAAQIKADADKKDASVEGKAGQVMLKAGGPAGLAAGVSSSISTGNEISDTAYYMIVGVVFIEILVILALLFNLWILLRVQRAARTAPAPGVEPAHAKTRIDWWNRLNRFKPAGQEAELDLGHDYDGIRELNNRLPPWWLYGFYATILFAGIYLWRYHVSHSAPLSGEEYQIAVKQAAIRKAEYLKNAANNVDENTVKLLTAPTDLAAGKAVFETTCFACHGKAGEGGVGPNLTDEYWLHGGSIQDVFKTIKYGWPDKGMKSWKDDYSPVQIAQIASYVRSLAGTHPANAKTPQGTIDK